MKLHNIIFDMEFVREDLKTGCYATYVLIDGKKEGEYRVYYPNGQLMEIFYYINDEIYGECKIYYENGQINQICNYILGKLNGYAKLYNEHGQLCANSYYINDQRIWWSIIRIL